MVGAPGVGSEMRMAGEEIDAAVRVRARIAVKQRASMKAPSRVGGENIRWFG